MEDNELLAKFEEQKTLINDLTEAVKAISTNYDNLKQNYDVLKQSIDKHFNKKEEEKPDEYSY